MRKSILARNLEIISAGGQSEYFKLVLLVVEEDADGYVGSFELLPYVKEIPSTVYHSSPLLLRECDDGRFRLTIQ